MHGPKTKRPGPTFGSKRQGVGKATEPTPTAPAAASFQPFGATAAPVSHDQAPSPAADKASTLAEAPQGKKRGRPKKVTP